MKIYGRNTRVGYCNQTQAAWLKVNGGSACVVNVVLIPTNALTLSSKVYDPRTLIRRSLRPQACDPVVGRKSVRTSECTLYRETKITALTNAPAHGSNRRHNFHTTKYVLTCKHTASYKAQKTLFCPRKGIWGGSLSHESG